MTSPDIDWPATWNPRSVAHDDAGGTLSWEALHRCTEAYQRRIAQDVHYAWTGQPRTYGDAVTICDFDVEPSLVIYPDTGVAWMAHMPLATKRTSLRLTAGTRLESEGWTGDQTEGLEALQWRLVDGPFEGRSILHSPDGGRYGAEYGLISGLIVLPDAPIAHDEVRRIALLRDLASMAPEVIAAPRPELPLEVAAVLDEARHLDPERLLAIAQTSSDHWGDKDLRALEDRAVAMVDSWPIGLRAILQTEVSKALHDETASPANAHPRVPTNFRAWQTLWRAALAVLARDLTPDQRSRLALGWERVKVESGPKR